MPLDSRSLPLPYADNFAAVRAMLPGDDLPWLRDLRTQAIERVRQAGLPTNRVERWKYTNLRGLSAAALRPSALLETAGAVGSLPPIIDRARVVFVDGRFRSDLSPARLPPGVTLRSLAAVMRDDPAYLRTMLQDSALDSDAMGALNLAFAADGWVVSIAAGASISMPIEIVHVATPGAAGAACHLRNLIVAGAGSSATLVETFTGDDAAIYWTQPVSEVRVEAGARLRHYRDQFEGANAFHTAVNHVRVDRDARYEAFLLTTGAGLSRNESRVILDGTGASCRLDGAYLARGRQHVDNTTEIIHAKPHTISAEVYKGVLDDQARGVFQGRIVVEKGAQKSDGHQLNKTILLSDRAEIDTKPELEIFADDVKCSHGATAGELDDTALFYLRARGIDLADARRMLVEAFIGDALENLSDDTVRPAFAQRIGAWMAHAASLERAA